MFVSIKKPTTIPKFAEQSQTTDFDQGQVSLSVQEREDLIAELLENQLRRRADQQISETPDWELWS